MPSPPPWSPTEMFTLIEQNLPFGRILARIVLLLGVLWFSVSAATAIWNAVVIPILTAADIGVTPPRPSIRPVDFGFLAMIMLIAFLANRAINHSHSFHMTVWDRFKTVDDILEKLVYSVSKLTDIEASRLDPSGQPPSPELPEESDES